MPRFWATAFYFYTFSNATPCSWYSHILRKYNINMIIIMGTKFIVLSSVEYVTSQNLKRTIVRKVTVEKNFEQFFCEPQNFHQKFISLFSKLQNMFMWWKGYIWILIPKWDQFGRFFSLKKIFLLIHCWNHNTTKCKWMSYKKRKIVTRDVS